MVTQDDSHYIRTRPSRLWSRLLSYVLHEWHPITTRGQWIRVLIFGLYVLKRRLSRGNRFERLVFIHDTGRTDTTILRIVLSIHH